MRENIVKAGVPDVTAAWAHEVGTARLLLGVAIKQRYPGHAKQAGHVAAMCHSGAYAGRYVIVVDDDIDVSNLEELIWAMLTRSDPATSIDIIRNAWRTPLDPRIEPERKAKGDFTNSRAIIDACRPWHWRDKFPKVNAPTPEQAKLARQTVRVFAEVISAVYRFRKRSILARANWVPKPPQLMSKPWSLAGSRYVSRATPAPASAWSRIVTWSSRMMRSLVPRNVMVGGDFGPM